MKDFDQKKILVTGATGLIGSYLVGRLVQEGAATVYVLGRREEKLRKAFSLLQRDRVVFLPQDASDPISVADDLDYIYHAAGPIDASTIREKPLDVILPNVVGLMNCFNLAMRNPAHPAKVVVFSSATVYPASGKVDACVTENDTSNADNLSSPGAVYSESKRMAEVIARACSVQRGARALVVRFGYVYGASCFLPETAFYEFIRRALTGEDIVLHKSGLPKRDNIFVDDAVSGLLTASVHGSENEVYNISSNGDGGNFAAVDEMAEIIAELANRRPTHKIRVRTEDPPRSRMPGVRLDNSKLKKLGWRIETSLRAGIEKTMQAMEGGVRCI